jgi:hypothetical protein
MHKRYSYIPTGDCACGKSAWTMRNFNFEHSLLARYEQEQVEIVCPDCNGTMSVFYRESLLEANPTKADKHFVNQSVQVPRFVAWVGYAKTPGTIFWSEKDQQDKMTEILAKTARISLEAANDLLHSFKGHYWLEDAARRRAKYLLRGEAFKSKPVLNDRGLWFMDKSIIVKIKGILRCVTGIYDRGYAPSSYYGDDGEPPELYNQVHHQLFYGCDERYNQVMIYPGDAKEVMPAD